MELPNSAIAPPSPNTVLERLRPFIDDTVDKLRHTTFREDPIGGRKYSRATSIISSAYKRHGKILEAALLERLKDRARLQVWREDEFKLSQESLKQLHVHERLEKCMRIQLEYGNCERTIPIDIVVFDTEAATLTSYNVKRGNGSYDGGKRRIIQGDLLRTHMLLMDYGRKMGIRPSSAQARIIFYYGLLSIPKPLALAGRELDEHFAFPVVEAIEQVNTYFRKRLYALIEEE
jgi:hypothetical protein